MFSASLSRGKSCQQRNLRPMCAPSSVTPRILLLTPWPFYWMQRANSSILMSRAVTTRRTLGKGLMLRILSWLTVKEIQWVSSARMQMHFALGSTIANRRVFAFRIVRSLAECPFLFLVCASSMLMVCFGRLQNQSFGFSCEAVFRAGVLYLCGCRSKWWLRPSLTLCFSFATSSFLFAGTGFDMNAESTQCYLIKEDEDSRCDYVDRMENEYTADLVTYPNLGFIWLGYHVCLD